MKDSRWSAGRVWGKIYPGAQDHREADQALDPHIYHEDINAKDIPEFDMGFEGIENKANRPKRKRLLLVASLSVHAGAAGDFSRLVQLQILDGGRWS